MPERIEMQVHVTEGINPECKVFDPRYIRAMYSAFRSLSLKDLFPDNAVPKDIAPALASVVGEARVLSSRNLLADGARSRLRQLWRWTRSKAR